MKVSGISAMLLASATTFVSATGGLKGNSRQLFANPDGPAQFATDGKAPDDEFEIPTLEELEEVYGAFCTLCELGDLLNADVQFCDLCDFEIPDFGGGGGGGGDIGGGDITCFSEVSTVQVENVGSVTMKNLKVGARVLTGSGSYEPVYAFGHKNAALSADFLQFQTANAKLEMTGGHLVFVEDKTNPVRADSIKVGDVLRGEGATVKKIKTVQREGVYSPLTPSGTVIVDGIAASSYISLQKNANEYVEMQGGFAIMSYQDFIHMALSPFRLFTMGVSSSMGNTYTEEGLPTFAAAGIDLAKWADSQNIVVQFVLFLAFFVVTGASMFAENTFGPSMAPLALVAGAGAYALMQKSNISFRANKIKSV